jgi:tetratricopeptide (TPR) repeat protein
MQDTDPTLLAKLQDMDSLWNPADFAASEASFRHLLIDAEKLSGRDRCYLIELKSLIARSEALQGRLPDAHLSLKGAEALLEEQQAAYRVSARIRWLLEKGRIHILEKTPSRARDFFNEAWTLAINSGEDYLAIEIAQLQATVCHQKDQLEWINRAIEIATQSPIPKTKRWLGGLYSTLGWKLFDARKFEKSLEVFQKSLRHLKAQGTPREAFVAQWSIGKVLRAIGQTEEALTIQKSLLAELGIGGERDGRLYEELAECLQTLKRTDEAQLYFELAYRELSNDQWNADNQPVKLKRMKDLGKVKTPKPQAST